MDRYNPVQKRCVITVPSEKNGTNVCANGPRVTKWEFPVLFRFGDSGFFIFYS
jgi:hypothetical protein